LLVLACNEPNPEFDGAASSGGSDAGSGTHAPDDGGGDGGTATGGDGGDSGGDGGTGGDDGGTGSSGGGDPACGNGVVDPGETCDDGNDDETDECTTLCEPPSCEDGIQSGDESDQDCGGSCEPCTAGQACFEHGDCESVACIEGVCADGLIPIDCSEEANLWSTASGTVTEVTWINISGEVRKLFWLNYQGTREAYETLQPDGEASHDTEPTHPWVITDADENCVQIFMPADEPAVAYLT
jgi:hypothetical protein